MSKGTLTKETIENLIEAAQKAKQNAYVPYSKYPVGAALLSDSGEIVSGCNVENASFGLSNCAERTAMFKAVSEGDTSFSAMAIIVDSDNYASPCGACRQVIMEFGEHAQIILANQEGEYRILSASDLLPGAFSKGELE